MDISTEGITQRFKVTVLEDSQAENMVPAAPVARHDNQHVCESSLRAEVAKLQEELAACRKSLEISRECAHQARLEAAKLRCRSSLLREVLGLFTERAPGWYSSVTVCAEDYSYWCRTAGLQ